MTCYLTAIGNELKAHTQKIYILQTNKQYNIQW